MQDLALNPFQTQGSGSSLLEGKTPPCGGMLSPQKGWTPPPLNIVPFRKPS